MKKSVFELSRLFKVDMRSVRRTGPTSVGTSIHTETHTHLEYGVVLPSVLGVVALQYTAANSGA